MVPLGAIATFQTWTGPVLVERYNLRRMVGLIVHPAPGVSLTEARRVCETVFAEVSQGFPEPKAFALESMRPVLPRHSLP